MQGVIDGTKPKNSCMQKSSTLTMSEDCLVLNIWSAQPQRFTKLKPVMFWIYGGGLQTGSIFLYPPYNGTVLATHDIVLVLTNYRLGPFGFLYGAQNDSQGNLGFYDQLQALKWV